MNEETDSAQRELFDDSDSTYAVVSGGRLLKSVSVPKISAETIHGPQDSTLWVTKIVTGCLYVDMTIDGAETHILTIYVKEGDTDATR